MEKTLDISQHLETTFTEHKGTQKCLWQKQKTSSGKEFTQGT